MLRDWLGGISQDLAFAVRGLVRDRRFTIAAVAALGLAIGVNNSVFALINTALIRELPFERSDRLVSVGLSDGRGPGPVSYPDFIDWRTGTTAFEELAGTTNSIMNVSEPDRPPERFRGAYVSANTFRALRSRPLIGRDFSADDDRPGAAAVVMLGHAAWQSRYHADPAVIGRMIRVNDVPATIVGVMPPGFKFPFNNELWQPQSVAAFVRTPRRDAPSIQAFGRLADNADLSRARADLEVVASRLARDFPDPRREKMRAMVISMREDYRVRAPMLAIFMAAVALVMLVACANLANLLLARSVARAREIALRVSLGASRWRIVRQLLLESGVIAVLAGVCGGLFSIYGANTIAVAFDPLEPGAPPGTTRPFFIDLSIDGTTMIFVGLLCAFATLACGLVPALHVSKGNVGELLKEGGRGTVGARRMRRWSGAFVVAQVALTLMLLASTGQIWREFVEQYRRDLVVDTGNLFVMHVGLPVQKYPTPELRGRFFDTLEQRLAAIPAIGSATLANVPPLDPFGARREVSFDGAGEASSAATPPQVSLVQTGARYFETVGLPIVRGRGLTPVDRLPGQEAAIVDERFVESHFPNSDPLGQRIRLTAPGGPATQTSSASPWLTIVGVVPTLPNLGPPDAARPAVYAPIGALPLQGPATILVRGRDLGASTAALREEVRALDPDLPLYAIETVDAAVARSRYSVRLIGTWFSIIAAIALVLASVGLYALTAHGVTQRTQEIGVRLALGARASQVLWLFLRGALLQLAIGLSLGIAGVLATSRLLRASLRQASPTDPLTLTLVVTVLILVALAASLLPARSAAQVDPMSALRSRAE